MKNPILSIINQSLLFANGTRATAVAHSPAGAFGSEAIVWVLPHDEQRGHEQACLIPTARKARARFLRAQRALA